MAEFCASTGAEIYCKKSHQDVQLDLRSKCANQAVTQQRRCQKDQEIEGNALLRCLHSQFARVVKGVDLRSTAGNCAWVRTPQLTFGMLGVFMVLPSCERKNMKSILVSIRGGRPKQCDATGYAKTPRKHSVTNVPCGCSHCTGPVA